MDIYQVIYVGGKKYVRIHQGRLTSYFYPMVLCYSGTPNIWTDWQIEPKIVQGLRPRYNFRKAS
jgi:hypothetical protein